MIENVVGSCIIEGVECLFFVVVDDGCVGEYKCDDEIGE